MALTLSAVLGLAQVLPVFHLVLVAHQLCAEHGQLVHAERDAAHAGEGRSTTPAAERIGSGSELHAHDHCGVAFPGQAHGVALAGARDSLRAPWVLESEPGALRRGHVSIELLAYAPKLPPPALQG